MTAKEYLAQNGIFGLDTKKRYNEVIEWMESYAQNKVTEALLNMNKLSFQIETVDRYWYYCGRNNRKFVEVTFWINPLTFERKETVRGESFFPSEEYKMPEWCKSIKEHRSSLDAQYY